MPSHWILAGLTAATLCLTGCSEQQSPSKTESPALETPRPDDTQAWEYMDAFGAMLNDHQKARAELTALDFVESNGDIDERFAESVVLEQAIVDVAEDRYSASINCVASFWIATEAGNVDAWHASNRIGSIVYITFASMPSRSEERHVSSEALDELRERIYTDYLIALLKNREKQLEDPNWAKSSVRQCNRTFPEPR